MRKRMSYKPEKLVAWAFTVILLLGLMPFGWISTAFAAAVTSFDVQLNPVIEGATVSLTDEISGGSPIEQITDEAGIAHFEDILDDECTYTIEITGVTGYTCAPETGVIVSEGGSHTVTLTEMETISITGTVQDSYGTPIPGVTVSASGYSTAADSSGTDGIFSLTLYEGQAYSLYISMTGYETQSFTLASGASGADYDSDSNVDMGAIILSEMETIAVTGVLRNAWGNPVSGATISATGYHVPADVTSNADGSFSLTLYKDQSYVVAINSIGFNEKTFASPTELNTSEDCDLGTIILYTRTYSIDTTAGTGGIISPDGTVGYSEDISIVITPTYDESGGTFYRLGTVRVDGTAVPISTPEAPTNLIDNHDGTYTYTFYNVTRNHNIVASFIRYYKIAFVIGANGAVEDEHENGISNGGTIMVDSDEDVSFTAIPDSGYHVSEVIIDNATDFTNDVNNFGNYTKRFDDVASNHEVEVIFSENIWPIIYGEAKNPSTGWSYADVVISVFASVTDGSIGEVRCSSSSGDYINDTYSSQLPTVMDMAYDPVSYTYTYTITSAVSHNYYIWAYDTAGNKSESCVSIPVSIDRRDPEVESFSIERNSSFLGSVLNFLTFGAFGNGTIDITVSVSDSGISSGLYSVSLYQYDTLGNETLVGTDTSVSGSSDVATFSIPASFTGTIKAVAEDNTGRLSGKVAATNANSNMNDAEGNIMLEVVSPTLSITPTSSPQYTDPEGKMWYTNDVSFEVSAGDVDSGINSIQININGTSIIDESYTSSKISNKSFVVSTSYATAAADDSYKVTVEVTDNAGNVKKDSLTIFRDTDSPVISVTYNNNADDSTFGGFYKANRTATITIAERNFNPAGVNFAISNTHGTVPSVPAVWSKTQDSTNPNLYIYTASVSFTQDGDYTFDVSCIDWLGNESTDYSQDAFTIDKTLPVIRVSYDNNLSLNSNYYQNMRTATITITEHNFEASRVDIRGTAINDGVKISFPSVSRWSGSGDKHTATITYQADAYYTFDISYSDKAGNAAGDYSSDSFYIDTAAPSVLITGIQDHSSNKDEVAPAVKYTDLNLADVTIELKGANIGIVELPGNEQSIDNGGIFTFEDFEAIKDMDDIYTLTAAAVDMAGNTTETSITFSVNRFGSVYVFSDEAKAIAGKYIQEGINVVITETNVDVLDTISIKISRNGTITDLVEGRDYAIEQTGGEGEWSQYTYTIYSSVFSGDGRYIVSIYSVDAAGNINENADETKQAELWFGVDKTTPMIVPVDFKENTTYAEDSKTVTILIDDNLVLDSVMILINDEPVDFAQDGNQYTFMIGSSNASQKISIVATDAAGNEITVEIPRVYVTTNIFVRWYADTTLFILSLCGVAILVAGAIILANIRKRKAISA